MEDTNMENTPVKVSEKESKFLVCFLIGLLVFLLVVIFLGTSTGTCDKCGKSFYGKGYYSSDALWSSRDAEITLCGSCAQKSWAPFDYRSHTK